MRFFYFFMLLCAVLGLIWTLNMGGAEGSWLGFAVPLLLGGGTATYYQLTRGNIWGNPKA